MKWESSSSVSIFLFIAVLFVSVNSSPSGKKDSLVNSKTELEKKINPSSGDGGKDDDLLARAKKSSTTTFCVEIKPGNEQPAVVVCDPTKTDHQVPIPNEPAPHHPTPAPHPQAQIPHHEPPNFSIPSTIPNYFPAEYNPRGLDPEPSYEPLIFIPQQPQIIQPQIIPPYYQPPQILQPISTQPQIIVIPNPGCPSNSPSIISNPNSPKFLYSRSSAASYGMMNPSNYLRSEYNPEGDMMRSIGAGSSLGGLVNNGYPNPLDLIYSKRGNNPQQNPLTNTVTLATGGQALVNTNQNFDGQSNRPVLIQCNPKVIPLSQEAYAAAVAGKANVNDQDFKSGMGTIQGSGLGGYQSQFMYQPGGLGQHGSHVHQTHGSALYNHQKGLPIHNQYNVDQYHQSNMYPYNKGYGNTYHKMASEFGSEGRAAENTEEAVKSGKVISLQQGQMMSPGESFTKNIENQKVQAGESQHISQASFNEQGLRHGVSASGDGKVPCNQDQQQKMGGQKQIEGNQNSETRFSSSSFSQGQNSFVNGDRMSKDQGLQKQMIYSQNQNQQQQQQIIPNAQRIPGMEQKNSQQSASGNDMQSYSQMLLQRMKSAVGQGNLVQPFMVPSSGLAGEKQTHGKV